MFVPGTGLVRNRVSDPYATSLTTDGAASAVLDLDDASTQPAGWKDAPRPQAPASNVDMVLYELHVRDFSRDDASVPAADRGKYLGFTHAQSSGMRHLRSLREAGLSDIHLLPVFDIATVPETGCTTPAIPPAAPDSQAQQAAVMREAAQDCFNWGYDPLHFGAPDGSYASDAQDPAARVRELRAMVQALHAAGLRVGMDVVYNHTHAAGQDRQSVLDRIVPGYYQRLDAAGKVETSTCCANTATEHAMMARLMRDTLVRWVRDYRIDSFRFDLMGHQPLAAMREAQQAVELAAGRRIPFIGEGWDFGEVADGARFVQAAQRQLHGSGIASFSDRMRDAARGGGCCDSGADLLAKQGWLTGLHVAPNGRGAALDRAALDEAATLVQVGLAGTLRDYRMTSGNGTPQPLSAFDYAGGPAGYAAQPGEVVNYVENHDNPTLYDIGVMKMAPGTPASERARVQVLGAALVLLAQGVPYLHAGMELLRSKSLDRNSFDSGDWFNPLDFSGRDNGFGRGLPPSPDNGEDWPLLAPLLADPANKPMPADIAFAQAGVRELLRMRAGTPLLRLRTAAEVARRLSFRNVGAGRDPALVVGHLDGRGMPDAGFDELIYLINTAPDARRWASPADAGKRWTLHPVQAAGHDARVRAQARFQVRDGAFEVPGRSAVVFVIQREAQR